MLFKSEDKRVLKSFRKNNCPIMKLIVPLEFELAYLAAAVNHFSHYATGTRNIQCHKNQMQKGDEKVVDFAVRSDPRVNTRECEK